MTDGDAAVCLLLNITVRHKIVLGPLKHSPAVCSEVHNDDAESVSEWEI